MNSDPIPLCAPEISGNEWAYLKECLDTNFVSSVGPFVDRFEREVAGRAGTRCGIATASGTAALHIALLVAGVEPEDEVLVSSLTFIAPANAVRYVGAWPVFMDADPVYWQMDGEKVRSFLQDECHRRDGGVYNKRTGSRVAAILPVHVLGHPVDMDPIIELAREYGLKVIEDATECLGARYKGRPAGSLADIACFSFNGNKIITTGGGGMITTNNEAWGKRAKYLTTQAKDEAVEFVHGEIGYNYRLTNLQAALGCAQLEQLDKYIAAKRRIAARYTEAFKSMPGLLPMLEAPWAESVFWMYTLLVDARGYGRDSRDLLRCLDRERIQARPLWQPMHRSPAHRQAQAYQCETAERLNREALSLPCSAGLSEEQQKKVIAVVTNSGRRREPRPPHRVAVPA
jgi:perosamine synthetase